MAKITLNDVAHSYDGGDSLALKPMSHEWHDGGAYALLGPSGCGKTTLLNIISGLLQPSEGQLLFDDIDVSALPTERRNIAQVFQFPVLYDTMTVAQNLAFPLRNRRGADRLTAGEIQDRVQQAITMLGLESLANRKARGLSADDQQKISLGRGLVRTDVNAILFDEPLTVIDPHLKWQLRTELKQIHRQFGHTMIYVTHDQTEALTFADQVAVMLAGEVIQMGTPQELFDTPRHTFVGKFIGSPGMNVLPCELQGTEAVIAGHRVPLAREYPALAGVIELGIRPELVRLVGDGATGDSYPGIPAQIVSVEDIGRHRIARATLQGHPLDIIVPEQQPIPAEARVAFDSDRINIYQNSQLVSWKSPS